MVKASSPTVKAIFILDSDGNRVCAKYYDKSYPTAKDQLALEKKLYLKTKNSNPRLEGVRTLHMRWGRYRGKRVIAAYL
ncbi:hypothetical protein FI667_g1578, partial [Globisporangium splendens]